MNDAQKKARIADYSVLRKPLITEKTAGMGSTVAFEVARSATKDEIRDAVERVFAVRVETVRTCNYLGKIRRVGKSVGRRAAWKKAYVTLAEGENLNLIEGL